MHETSSTQKHNKRCKVIAVVQVHVPTTSESESHPCPTSTRSNPDHPLAPSESERSSNSNKSRQQRVNQADVLVAAVMSVGVQNYLPAPLSSLSTPTTTASGTVRASVETEGASPQLQHRFAAVARMSGGTSTAAAAVSAPRDVHATTSQ